MRRASIDLPTPVGPISSTGARERMATRSICSIMPAKRALRVMKPPPPMACTAVGAGAGAGEEPLRRGAAPGVPSASSRTRFAPAALVPRELLYSITPRITGDSSSRHKPSCATCRSEHSGVQYCSRCGSNG